MSPIPPPASNDATRVPWHRRLATKIAVGEALSAGSLVFLAVVACLVLTQRALGRAEGAQVRTSAHMLAASVPVENGALSASRLSELLGGLADHGGLASVRLVDLSGRPVLDWHRPGTETGDTARTETVDVVDAAGHKVGTLSATASREMMRGFSQELWRVVPPLIVLALVLSLGAAYVTGTRIARHIHRTAMMAADVARGHLGVEPIAVRTSDEVGLLAARFNELLSSLRYLHERAHRVAQGDLAMSIEGEGDLAEVFRAMLESLRELVERIRATTLQLNSASEEILATAGGQEKGATEQSAAVEETRRTMESLLASGQHIAEVSETVLGTAERTHKNNEIIAERIGQLSAHTERVGEILQVIKEIAGKSDILALNAALEGAKAGEAGRGFSLVASQMQRLAENVMGAVKDIQVLTADIQEATTQSVLATEEGIKLAGATTDSAREISRVIQEQQSGIEQVTLAMNDVTKVAHATVAANRDVTSAISDLLHLSRELQKEVEAFTVKANGSAVASPEIRSVA